MGIPFGLAMWSFLAGQPPSQFIPFAAFGLTTEDCFALSAIGLVVVLSFNWIRRNPLFAYFIVSLVVLSVTYGFAVGKHRIYPYPLFAAGDRLWAQARMAATDWGSDWQDNLQLRPTRQLHRTTRSGNGVLRRSPQAMQPGPTLLVGFWDNHLGVKLIAADGALLHEWDVAYGKFRQAVYNKRNDANGDSDFNRLIHGVVLLPDGDIVFNYDNNAMVRMSWCGTVSWILEESTHHAISRDQQGNFWAPLQRPRDGREQNLPFPDGLYWEESVAKISPDGKILREFPVIEALYRGEFESALATRWNTLSKQMRNPRGEHLVEDLSMVINGAIIPNVTHLNSAQVLSPALADRFPAFKAGDILVSLRGIDMIAVIDPNTERVVWAQSGPFLRQHDAQFLPDGHLLVFDNYLQPLGGSRIVLVDPDTRKVTTRYRGTPSDPFFTAMGGKVQPLANGNLLITEFAGGRAFEVTPAGQIVWEFLNRYDQDHVATLTQATRYPPSFADLAGRSCH
ncbi:arylsulfotransferase family protein [Endothiovibrio diazotrophicus]